MKLHLAKNIADFNKQKGCKPRLTDKDVSLAPETLSMIMLDQACPHPDFRKF